MDRHENNPGALKRHTVGVLASWLLWGGGRADLFAPTVAMPLAYAVFFAVGSLNVLRTPPRGLEWALFARQVDRAVPALAVVGLLAYFVGVWAARSCVGFFFQRSEPAPPSLRFEYSRGRIRLVAAVCAIMAVLTLSLGFLRSGVPFLSGSVGMSRLAFAHTNGTIIVLYLTLMSVAVVFALLNAADPFKAGSSRSTKLMLMGVVLLAGIGALLLGSRSALIEMCVIAVPLVYYLKPNIFKRWRILVAAGVSVFLFVSLFGYWRDMQLSGKSASYYAVYAKAGIPVALQPFAQPYIYLRNTVVTFGEVVRFIPEKEPFQRGTLLLAGAFQFLPGYHEGAEIFFSRLLSIQLDGGAGIPASLLGVFYADFGVIGIVAGLSVLGFTLQSFYCHFIRHRSVESLVAYAYLIKVALWSLILGPLPYTTTFTVPMLLGVSMSFARSPQGRNRAGWPPSWLLYFIALMMAGAVIVFFKHDPLDRRYTANSSISSPFQDGLQIGRSDSDRKVIRNARSNRWTTGQQLRDFQAGYSSGYDGVFTGAQRRNGSVRIGSDYNISWYGPPSAQIYVQLDNGPRRLFASGEYGTQPAAWMTSGHRYLFVLQDQNGNEIARDQSDLRQTQNPTK